MLWLLLALGLSAFSAWVVVWWHRRPRSLNHGIHEFSRGLEALAPREARPPAARSAHPPRQRAERRPRVSREPAGPGTSIRRRSRERR